MGGFVYALPELHKIVANAFGTYLEIETAADPHYDSTGLTRVHHNDCGTTMQCLPLWPVIGPTAAPPQENGGATPGVWWQLAGDAPSRLRRLGNLTYKDVAAVVLTPGFNSSARHVTFSVQYVVLADGLLITENYDVHAGGSINVTASVSAVGAVALKEWLEVAITDDAAAAAAAGHRVRAAGDGAPPLLQLRAPLAAPPSGAPDAPKITGFGVSMLLFQYDGDSTTGTELSSAGNLSVTARVGRYGWGQQIFSAGPAPSGHAITWVAGNTTVATRNGRAMIVDARITPVATDSPSMAYALTAEREWEGGSDVESSDTK